MAQQPKKKVKKTINGIPKGCFDRLLLLIEFEDDLTDLNDVFWKSYVPRVLATCNTSWYLPKDPLDIDKYRRKTSFSGGVPYFKYPKLPSCLPAADPGNDKIVIQNKYPSIIPLLMTANHAGIDTKNYHLVSQRNSIRKLAMNDENFVMSVVRFGSTLFFRRFSSYRIVDKSNSGFLFEEMCTCKCNGSFDFNQLIESNIGQFKLLMLGEVDAINKNNGESIELKCHMANLSKKQEKDWWLQAFLSGTNSIIHGRYSGDKTKISNLREYRTSELSDDQSKTKMFNRLHRVVQFLFSNVEIKRSYLLRGYKDEKTNVRSMKLFEVVDEKDKKNFTFVTEKLLNKFSPKM